MSTREHFEDFNLTSSTFLKTYFRARMFLGASASARLRTADFIVSDLMPTAQFAIMPAVSYNFAFLWAIGFHDVTPARQFHMMFANEHLI